MTVTINIPDTEIPYWQEVYTTRYDKLIKQQNDLEVQLKQMTPILLQLGIIHEEPTPIEPTVQELNGYDPSWKWLTKIEYLLEKAGRSKTSNEIVEEILKREPNETRSRLMNSVPATLSTAANSPSTNLKRQKNENGEFQYWVENLPF